MVDGEAEAGDTVTGIIGEKNHLQHMTSEFDASDGKLVRPHHFQGNDTKKMGCVSQPTIRTEQGYDFVECQPMLEMKKGDGRDDVRHEHQGVGMTIEVDESSGAVGRYRIVGGIGFEETQQLPRTLSVRFDVVDVTIHHGIDSGPEGKFGSAKEVMD